MRTCSDLRIAADQIIERTAPIKFPPERLRGHRLAFAVRDLNKGVAGGHVADQKYRHAYHTLVANRRDLDHTTVCHDVRHRPDTPAQKIDGVDLRAMFVENLFELQRHRRQRWQDALVVGRREAQPAACLVIVDPLEADAASV